LDQTWRRVFGLIPDRQEDCHILPDSLDTKMTAETAEQLCPACGQRNDCALANGKSASACWCMGTPAKLPVPESGTACYCPRCLRELTSQESADAR